MHDATWAMLDRYRAPDEQRPWWNEFVSSVLGKPSAAGEDALGDPTVIPPGVRPPPMG